MLKVVAKRAHLHIEGQEDLLEIEGRDVDPETLQAVWAPGFFGRPVVVVGISLDLERIPSEARKLLLLNGGCEPRPGVLRRRSANAVWPSKLLLHPDDTLILSECELRFPTLNDPYRTARNK